ncbi:hypothetical protein CLU81_3571 [Flavobacterium sp. 9]|uniref:hypothetical protein n=1 Tax=Flavobacterium sp. 9 TaxID=2035198 RepID=UPI000C196745|nr:hypothetical protein [Flavobacterium sp. 9]PIF33001.1 hypothetical protein CLU81_3571 [Flavobacterium sp. 9]
MIPLEDIGGESCEPVSGFVDTIYYAERNDFTTINDPKKMCDPVPANVATSFADLATITPDHVFKAGKKFFKVETVTESGNIKSVQIGEPGRGLYQNDYVYKISGSEAEVLGYLRWIKNKKLVVLVEEFGTGNVRQLGSSKFPARAKGEHIVEGLAEGENAATITITDKNFGPSPIYKGDILTVIAP